MVVLILMPIFLVSATESIGDLTATNALSGYPTGDSVYWGRVRGGLMGDAFNSGLASAFATFPNTTFSQNNGLIRLTGESRPHIGLYAATFIGVLGLIPLLSSVAQLIPAPVINVVTVILFAMVAWAGWQVFSRQADSLRSWIVFLGGAAGGYTLAAYAEAWAFLPEGLRQIVSFPVSTGAVLGLILEWLLPKGRHFRSS
jgi:NCS2 family nucleobase:cation symporter-2/xanthine permease XanP